MGKALQVSTVKRLFAHYNPSVSSDEIDFSSEVDPSLHLDENIERLSSQFPQYEWGLP